MCVFLWHTYQHLGQKHVNALPATYPWFCCKIVAETHIFEVVVYFVWCKCRIGRKSNIKFYSLDLTNIFCHFTCSVVIITVFSERIFKDQWDAYVRMQYDAVFLI